MLYNQQSKRICCFYYEGFEMNKRPELVAQTKRNISEAFWNLYKYKRIEQISVSEICKTAGYNRTTFYKYFSDPYDVLNKLEEKIIGEFSRKIHISFQSQKNEADFIEMMASLYCEKGDYLGVLLSEHGDPFFTLKIKKKMSSLLLKQFTLEESDPNTEYIVEFGMSSIIGTLTHWFNRGMNVPAEDLATLLRTMLTSAVQQYQVRM